MSAACGPATRASTSIPRTTSATSLAVSGWRRYPSSAVSGGATAAQARSPSVRSARVIAFATRNPPAECRRSDTRCAALDASRAMSRASDRTYVPPAQVTRSVARRTNPSASSTAHCSIACTVTIAGASATGVPTRASAYARTPPMRFAEYEGGTCSRVPTRPASAAVSAARVGSAAVLVTVPSRSSVSVSVPNWTTAS